MPRTVRDASVRPLRPCRSLVDLSRLTHDAIAVGLVLAIVLAVVLIVVDRVLGGPSR